MYAIRSYYESFLELRELLLNQRPETLAVAEIFRLAVAGDADPDQAARRLERQQHQAQQAGLSRTRGSGQKLEGFVITSYSIHYTKLYESPNLIPGAIMIWSEEGINSVAQQLKIVFH